MKMFFPASITPFPCPFSVLAIASFIYYTSVPVWDRNKHRSKINKQGCGLARKGHGNGVYDTSMIFDMIKLLFRYTSM